MPFLDSESRSFLKNLSRLAWSNPFSREWVEREKEALHDKFQPVGAVHLWTDEQTCDHPNLVRLTERTEKLARKLLGKLGDGATPKQEDRSLYQHLIVYLLHRRHRKGFDGLIASRELSPAADLWQEFLADFEKFLRVPRAQLPPELSPEHLFALFFQIRRAFHYIFDRIAGSSDAVIELRAQVWNSIFTHDIQYYAKTLYAQMCKFNTLITGESGTGKELAAEAIGMSQYIPFDPEKRQFKTIAADSFRAVNLAGMPPSLLESELFGHVKGAFTGALCNKKGWLETASDSDALFLDEIGELNDSIQVKLLRALETRKFCRVGSRTKKDWKGKIIAATNRDLAEEVRKGRFREDFYYRLCGDVIVTPSLHKQLSESPEDLGRLVQFATRQFAGNDCTDVADRVTEWIVEHLPEHDWPGNFRELGQCARNVLIRGKYCPLESAQRRESDGIDSAIRALAKQGLSKYELLRTYCGAVYEEVGGNYEAAGNLIGLNWRTVKKYISAAAAATSEQSRRSGLFVKPR